MTSGGQLRQSWFTIVTRMRDCASTHLDVHEERPRGLDELLKLVLAELGLGGGVEEIDSESLQVRKKSGCVSF